MTIATIHQENVPLFFDKKNQDLYWEALIQIAQNHKQNAMQIAEEIKKKNTSPHLF